MTPPHLHLGIGVRRSATPGARKSQSVSDPAAKEENMADSRNDADAGDDSGPGVGPDSGKTGLAFWQKVVGIIGLLVILVIVIALLVGGGHTPPVQHGTG